MNITNRFEELRKKEKITQEQLAEVLGIKRENISKWENNVAEPSRENLIKFADYFNVSTDYLLNRSAPPPPSQQSRSAVGE